MESISCHITLLIINSLGGGHTNAHTYRCPHRDNFKKLCVLACAPGLKTILGAANVILCVIIIIDCNDTVLNSDNTNTP